jgi:hypothetical protein
MTVNLQIQTHAVLTTEIMFWRLDSFRLWSGRGDITINYQCIRLCLGARRSGVRIVMGGEIFFFFKSYRRAPGLTQRPFQWVPGSVFTGKAAGA